MKVFAVYSERKTPLVRVWMESWGKQGWVPQLLSAKEIAEHGSPRRAAEKRGGGVLADVLVINFSHPPRRRAGLRAARFGKPGWLQAPLVRFSFGTTEEEVRGCGRAL